MANDHFVAQTYLRHWLRPGQKLLHAYSKASAKEFPCRPADICHEWDGDLIQNISKTPTFSASFVRFLSRGGGRLSRTFRPERSQPTINSSQRGIGLILRHALPLGDAFALRRTNAELRNLLPIVVKDIEVPQGG